MYTTEIRTFELTLWTRDDLKWLQGSSYKFSTLPQKIETLHLMNGPVRYVTAPAVVYISCNTQAQVTFLKLKFGDRLVETYL